MGSYCAWAAKVSCDMRTLRWRCDRMQRDTPQHNGTQDVAISRFPFQWLGRADLVAVVPLRHMCLCLCFRPWAYAGDLHDMLSGPSIQDISWDLEKLTGFSYIVAAILTNGHLP